MLSFLMYVCYNYHVQNVLNVSSLMMIVMVRDGWRRRRCFMSEIKMIVKEKMKNTFVWINTLDSNIAEWHSKYLELVKSNDVSPRNYDAYC